MMLRSRIVAPALAASVAFSAATPAWADDKAACVAAHEEGQIARRAGHFDRARQDFASCQREVCPEALRTRCADFARQLEQVQPSIVVSVRDRQGADVGGARVALDSAPPSDVATLAVAVRLDPGVHTLHVEASGFVAADKTITVPEGAKDMQIAVTLERPASALAPPPHPQPAVTPVPPPRASHAAAWGFTIGSGVALAAAGALSAVGWAMHGNLHSSCGGNCSQDQVQPLRVIWPASFVALGVGVASAVVATILFLQHPDTVQTSPAAFNLSQGAFVFQ